MGANPLPRPGRYRKGAIYADCAIVRVKRGREGRGPHLILGGSAESREFPRGGNENVLNLTKKEILIGFQLVCQLTSPEDELTIEKLAQC